MGCFVYLCTSSDVSRSFNTYVYTLDGSVLLEISYMMSCGVANFTIIWTVAFTFVLRGAVSHESIWKVLIEVMFVVRHVHVGTRHIG